MSDFVSGVSDNVVLQDFSLGPRIDDDVEYGVLSWCLGTGLIFSGTMAVEFGVGSGTSTRLIAQYMPVVGFDSFTGLPEDWRDGYPKGSLAFTAPVVVNTRLVIGQFADTLPGFDWSTAEPIGLVHFDADLYSSTVTALHWIGPYLRPGCVLVFDEFHGYDGAEDHEQLAWREYAVAHGISWDVIGHGRESWAIALR